MNYKTYEWNRKLPENTSKTAHYRSLEQLILEVTKDIETDITCTCCGSMVPIMFFFENISCNKVMPTITGRYLYGTENNISFFIDPTAEVKTMTFEADGNIIAVIRDTWDN